MDDTGDPAPPLREQFLSAMAQMACTVNIVTTDGPAGRYGLTVSAMASVSAHADRPILLVCVNHESPTARAIRANGVFCVNVLRDRQAAISDCFAGRSALSREERFECATWVTQPSGAPAVEDCLAAFDCMLMSSVRAGTHEVLFGEVATLRLNPAGPPLVYANRSYGRIAALEPQAPA